MNTPNASNNNSNSNSENENNSNYSYNSNFVREHIIKVGNRYTTRNAAAAGTGLSAAPATYAPGYSFRAANEEIERKEEARLERSQIEKLRLKMNMESRFRRMTNARKKEYIKSVEIDENIKGYLKSKGLWPKSFLQKLRNKFTRKGKTSFAGGRHKSRNAGRRTRRS
jgi:hypothetical protein